jgi:hypothetical protein
MKLIQKVVHFWINFISRFANVSNANTNVMNPSKLNLRLKPVTIRKIRNSNFLIILLRIFVILFFSDPVTHMVYCTLSAISNRNVSLSSNLIPDRDLKFVFILFTIRKITIYTF